MFIQSSAFKQVQLSCPDKCSRDHAYFGQSSELTGFCIAFATFSMPLPHRFLKMLATDFHYRKQDMKGQSQRKKSNTIQRQHIMPASSAMRPAFQITALPSPNPALISVSTISFQRLYSPSRSAINTKPRQRRGLLLHFPIHGSG
ncbi:hypothetical protein ACFO1V_06890 [Daeguia caeni]|uniref:Uncharacterized protein n=1 Tax=Daeguia caeni TaxID=439612 RepID=A0ABV9H7M5_9HYPH